MDEMAFVTGLREVWKQALPEFEPGWPDEGPGVLLPRRLKEHLSHYNHSSGRVIYRCEPYGPLDPEEVVAIASLILGGWTFCLTPLGSTRFPGSSVRLEIWKRKE